MPRRGWRKPESDRRLSDLVSIGVLSRVFPAALVEEVIAAAGRTEQRDRVLPARVMAYFVIGMSLDSRGSYRDVMSMLMDGLAWGTGWAQTYRAPTAAAISLARVRLGSEPVAGLFARVAVPLAGPDTPGAWLAGRRLVAVDGTSLDVPDTPVNEAYFGRPNLAGGPGPFPKVRVLALAECATHAVIAARVGRYVDSEIAMMNGTDGQAPLTGAFAPGMLVIADRGFFSFDLWRRAVATGADLLWRVNAGVRHALRPTHVADLPDGSWLADLVPAKASKNPPTPSRVRVLDYQIDDGRDNPVTYRLLTTILDPDQADLGELAAAYARRWEIESIFDELKTHQRGPRVVLRSKSPDLVLQETWGHLCCHYAIRSLMADTAEHAGHDPDRISFTATLRIARESLAHQGAFPP